MLPPGNSGYVPQAGANPHLTDQLPLFESFAFKPAGFDQPGTPETPRSGVTITRDAYGVPSIRARNDASIWFGVGYAVAQDRLVQLELFRRGTQGRLAEVLGESRLASDIVARRDYYTRAELQRMLRRLPACGARLPRRQPRSAGASARPIPRAGASRGGCTTSRRPASRRSPL